MMKKYKTYLTMSAIVIMLMFTTFSETKKDLYIQSSDEVIKLEDDLEKTDNKIYIQSADEVVEYEVDSDLNILNTEEQIDIFIEEISKEYELDSNLIRSIIWHESRFDPNAKNGSCLGLMQVSTRWHSERAKELGVSDFYDPRGNILLGVDYISELLIQYEDLTLALMCYNMSHTKAKELYSRGETSIYADRVISRMKKLSEGVLS